MTALRGRSKTGSALAWFALFSAPVLLVDCGKLPGAKNLPGGLPGSCPANIADASAILSANFGLEGELEGKVKAALAAGANLQKIAVDVEGDVTTACSNLAKDLGVSEDALKPAEDGPGKKAEAACNAAVKAMGELKAKAGAKLTVDVKPPECHASLNAMAECAGRCDATVTPGEAKVECEGGKLSGKCEGKCEGSCTVEAGGKCEGSCNAECSGTCTADFVGKCDGTCNGKCEGQNSNGKCAGTCEGKCEGKAQGNCNGECKGSCSGSCEVSAQASCEGTCSGSCSVEFKEPKCTGTVKPPEMSAECKANCDAEVNANLECTPAHVFAKVEAASDVKAAAQLRSAIEKNLPALLKVSVGMKDRVDGVVGNVRASLEGVQGAVTSGGTAAAKVAGCFAASMEAQASAAVSIDVSVKASASASGSVSSGS